MKFPLFLLAVVCLGLLASCCDEVTVRVDGPMDRAIAVTELPDFPLPASADSVSYLFYAGGMQDLEKYVRFDCKPEELDAAVDALVDWNNKSMGRVLAYPREPLEAAKLAPPRAEFLPMPWWNPETVTKGYYQGHQEAYALRILVDEENSRVYVYQDD